MKTGTPDKTLMGMQILAALAYTFIVFLPLLAIVECTAWTTQDAFLKVGKGGILVVFSVAALQPVLAARLKLLDRLFGLDIIYVFHKTMGILAGMTLICSIIFLSAGPNRFLPWPGIVGTLLLISLVFSALLYRELHMTYGSWRNLHNVLFIAAFGTVFLLTWLIVTSAGSLPAKVIVSGALIIATSIYIVHKFAGPFRRKKHLYRIEKVTNETKNVWTLTFKPPEGDTRFEYLPGQFQFLTFDGGAGEEHPFTISSSPTQKDYHAATIKESGDFTRTIGSEHEGSLIAVQAPFGRFSYVLHPEERDLVFIAGGIGVTPFMSMLRHMRDTGSNTEVLLIYVNRTEEDIAFRKELDDISSKPSPQLSIIHVLSRAGDNWEGERGHVNRALIEKKIIGDLRTKTFYLCGPPSMMTATMAMLLELGIPSSRIRSERFAL
jgi:predicted ferric reductase